MHGLGNPCTKRIGRITDGQIVKHEVLPLSHSTTIRIRGD